MEEREEEERTEDGTYLYLFLRKEGELTQKGKILISRYIDIILIFLFKV